MSLLSKSFSTRRIAAVLLPFALAVTCPAQDSPASPGSRPVIVLDPAHGGPDSGAHLADQVLEKDVTLAIASRVRSALTAAGFTVVATRDSDLTAVMPADQRAEVANRPHVLACLILHATAAGSGAHLYVSALQPAAGAAPAESGQHSRFAPTPWNTAQAAAIPQSLELRARLSDALEAAHVPMLRGRASIAPIDRLLCPAVAVELAPLGDPGGDRTAVTDADYQQRVAGAVVQAIKAFRDAQSSATAASAPPGQPGSPGVAQ